MLLRSNAISYLLLLCLLCLDGLHPIKLCVRIDLSFLKLLLSGKSNQHRKLISRNRPPSVMSLDMWSLGLWHCFEGGMWKSWDFELEKP